VPPLALAVNENQVEMARLLLAYGADADYQNKEGRSLLHECARFDRLVMARALIAAGASVNVTDRSGHTPAVCATTDAMRQILSEPNGVARKECGCCLNAQIQDWMMYYAEDFLHRTNDARLTELLARELGVWSRQRFSLQVDVHDGPVRALAAARYGPAFKGLTLLQKAVQQSNVALIRFLRSQIEQSPTSGGRDLYTKVAKLSASSDLASVVQQTGEAQSASSIELTSLQGSTSGSAYSNGMKELWGTPPARGPLVSNRPRSAEVIPAVASAGSSESRLDRAHLQVEDLIVEQNGAPCHARQVDDENRTATLVNVRANCVAVVRSPSNACRAISVYVPEQTETVLRGSNGHVQVILRAEEKAHYAALRANPVGKYRRVCYLSISLLTSVLHCRLCYDR